MCWGVPLHCTAVSHKHTEIRKPATLKLVRNVKLRPSSLFVVLNINNYAYSTSGGSFSYHSLLTMITTKQHRGEKEEATSDLWFHAENLCLPK